MFLCDFLKGQLVCILITSLLRNNLYNIKFTHLECIIQWDLGFQQTPAIITTNFKTILSLHKETSSSLATIPHFSATAQP